MLLPSDRPSTLMVSDNSQFVLVLIRMSEGREQNVERKE